MVRVQPPKDWIALATLPGMKIVEPGHQRVPANDLSRVTVGVAANTLLDDELSGSERLERDCGSERFGH